MAAKKSRPSWDAQPRKVRSDAKIKNLPEEDQLTLWQLMNPPENGGEAYSQEAAAVWLLQELDLEVSTETVSQWHSWYAFNRRMENASDRAAQSKQRYAMENPKAALEELEAYGQFVFTTETVDDMDVLNFTRLRKLTLLERAADQKDETLKQKDREIAQKDQLIEQNDRRIQILESNERRKQETEDAINRIKSDATLSVDEQRKRILEQTDEFFGLKKKSN